MKELIDTFELVNNLYGDGKPKCIIANTVKGHGIPVWERRSSSCIVIIASSSTTRIFDMVIYLPHEVGIPLSLPCHGHW